MPDIFVSDSKIEEPVAKKNSEKVPAATDNFSATAGLYENNSTVHLFTSYCEAPADITFENQDEDETVVLFIRKDLITNLPWLISGIIFLLLPLLIPLTLSLLNITLFSLPQNYLFVSIGFYYLLIASFIFINFITWYFNIDIVTQKRVVDIDFEGIVYKNIAATKISLVQDVSYSQVGAMRTIFNYGDVLVQTAGTIENFIFEAVPRPEDAVHVIENLIGKHRE